jgi:hypothetical protein
MYHIARSLKLEREGGGEGERKRRLGIWFYSPSTHNGIFLLFQAIPEERGGDTE